MSDNKRKHGKLDCFGCGMTVNGLYECSNYKIWWNEILEEMESAKKNIRNYG